MTKKSKQKPPRGINYEIIHPTMSFRAEKKLYDGLKTLLKNKNQSIGDFFKL